MAKRKKCLNIYKESKKKKGIFLILKVFSVFSALLFSSLVLGFIYYARELPRPENFLERKVFQSTKIYDRTGTVLLHDIYGEEKRKIIPIITHKILYVLLCVK